MENAAPYKILQYHLNQKIGSGFAGDTYHAWDSGLDRKVTVRIIAPELAIYNPYRSQLMTTALTVKDLDHPHVARLYTVEEYEDSLIVVMEYVEGVTLKSLIEKGQTRLSQFLKIAVQVIDGLNAISKLEMGHNYLTSSNIIVAPNGAAKITDYGLSPTPHMVRNESGFVDNEKLIYMSPELLKGETVTALADQYSLGIIFYEALTSNLPFDKDSREELIRKIENPTLNGEKFDDVSNGAILLLITKMTAILPEDRFADFDELAAAINEINLAQNMIDSRSLMGPDTKVKPGIYLMTSLVFLMLILYWLIVKGLGG